MALIPYDIGAKIRAAIIEALSVAGQASVAVVNPDGSNIGAGGGTSDVNVTQIGGVSTATGSGNVSSGTQRVVEAGASTPSNSNISSSATNVTLLAANSARRGATIYNDSTQILYLKLGATASNTSYTTQMIAGAYYEVPYHYTGIIDGIWAAANGNARITELT